MKIILFASFFFSLVSSLKLSDEFASMIQIHETPIVSRNLEVLNDTIPLGWMQGIQYFSPTCSGNSFVTTNIALGLCIRDGDSSSYMQYVLLDPLAVPTTYIFYVTTFSDSICNNVITTTNWGSLNPSMVCLPDNGNDGISKTVYYYPGSNPPLYPYNGILTQYHSNSTGSTCSGEVLKTVILNPTTCFTNMRYNSTSSDPYNYQTYTTQCDAESPLYYTLFSDTDCTVPISINNTIYGDVPSCQNATDFRKNGLPELYLVDNPAQFNYENAMATCYLGSTVFLRNQHIPMHLEEEVENDKNNNVFYDLYEYILNMVSGIVIIVFN